MKPSSHPRFQPRLEVLEDRCTPSTMPDSVNPWAAAGLSLPPNVAPAATGLLQSVGNQAVTAASTAFHGATRTVPFMVDGGGPAPQGVPEFPGGTAPHSATGWAAELGNYTGEGIFKLLSIDLSTLTGTFQGTFNFVAANGDILAMNYGAAPSNPGKLDLIPVGNNQYIAVFLAQFTPDPSQSTGRFADDVGGGFTMLAVSTPFSLTPSGYTTPFNYTWTGEGALEFATGH